jgi:MFS family permease
VALPQQRPARAHPLLARTFAALGQRDFRIFFIGQAISVTGTWMQTVALGWLVLLLTGSPLALGIAFAARTAPVMVLSFVGGMAADRFDRRRLLLVVNGAAGIVSVTLAAMTALDLVDMTAVIVLSVLLGVTNAFEMPARQSYVVELSGREHLANAIALNSLMFNGARILGPAIAGVVVAAFGPAPAFVVNAVTYIPILVSLWLVRARSARVGTRFRGALGATVAYLRLEPRVAGLLGLLSASSILASGHFTLGPAVAADLGQDADGFGILMSATGIWAVAAGLVLAAGASRTGRGRGRILVGSALGLAAAEVLVGLAGGYLVTVLAFGFIGMSFVSYNATSNTLLQSIVPDEMRGRVMSLFTLALMGLMPVGSLLLGAIGDVIGSATAIAIGGAAWGVVALATFLVRRDLRRL